MKKFPTFVAMLLMGAATLGFASCGDDDDDASNGGNGGNSDKGSKVSYTHCPDDNHPHAIDLGLPSGLKWTCCNVGASSPGEDGDYFAWGETSSKSCYNWDTYKWGDGYTFTKYTRSGKTTLDPEDDAATQNWGKGCRMPTVDEFEELLNNTTSEWTEMYGVYGRKFTSKKSSAFVFFPASGYCDSDYLGGYLGGHGSYGKYWSSSLVASNEDFARYLGFNSGRVKPGYNYSRYRGFPVRPVAEQ